MFKLCFIGCKMLIDGDNVGSIFHLFVVNSARVKMQGVSGENEKSEYWDERFDEHMKLFKKIMRIGLT